MRVAVQFATNQDAQLQLLMRSASTCSARLTVEWQITSAPCSNGRVRKGVAMVLSTISGTPALWATSARGARSVTDPPVMHRGEHANGITTRIPWQYQVMGDDKLA